MSQFQTLSLASPVKVNLALHVVGQREDGYHLLDTLVVFSEDGDYLTFSPANKDQFLISGTFKKGLLEDQANLVTRARDALRAAFPNETTPVCIKLEKNLPVASGIGGGSGDAAATLIGLCRYWQLECSLETLVEIALPLGADVPMCLYGMSYNKALNVQGIGEDITLLPGFPSLDIVLVNPGVNILTQQVFSHLKQKENPPMMRGAIRNVSAMIDMLKKSRNDLLEPVLEQAPIINDVIAALNYNESQYSRMSGSGATCFGIFEDAKSARCAARDILQKNPDWFVLATKTKGSYEPY